MPIVRTKIGNGGRVIIPAHFRQNLHLDQGSDIILHMQDEAIYITTPKQALHKLQKKVQDLLRASGQNISLVDELISTRRAEAEKENE